MQRQRTAFPSGTNERIRWATVEDLRALSRIALEAKRHWGYPEEWIRAWTPLLSVVVRDLSSLDIFVAQSGTAPVGFCAVASVDGIWNVEHLWVLPEHMGRQVGRCLWEHAVAHVIAQGGDRLRVESDPHAEGFYQKLGARRIGRIPAHMGDTERFLPVLQLSLI